MNINLSLTISNPGSKFAPIVLQGEYITEMKKAKEIGYKAVEKQRKLDTKLLNSIFVIRK